MITPLEEASDEPEETTTKKTKLSDRNPWWSRMRMILTMKPKRPMAVKKWIVSVGIQININRVRRPGDHYNEIDSLYLTHINPSIGPFTKLSSPSLTVPLSPLKSRSSFFNPLLKSLPLNPLKTLTSLERPSKSIPSPLHPPLEMSSCLNRKAKGTDIGETPQRGATTYHQDCHTLLMIDHRPGNAIAIQIISN